MADHIDLVIRGHIQTLKKRKLTLERMIKTFDASKSKDPNWILQELAATSFAITLLKDLYENSDEDDADTYGYDFVVTKNGHRLDNE